MRSEVESSCDKIFCPKECGGFLVECYLGKEQGKIVYSCDRCDHAWLTMDDVLLGRNCMSRNDSLRVLGFSIREQTAGFDTLLVKSEHLNVDDVWDVMEKYDLDLVEHEIYDC